MKRTVIAAALTWDGARVPLRAVPIAARAFLRGGGATLPPAGKLAAMFADNGVDEIRVCWVPRLQSGETLAFPFPAPGGKRIAYRATTTKRFGDVLGVVYRR